MALRAHELALVVDELSRSLAGALVQKAFAPFAAVCYLEVRHRGRSVLLFICAARHLGRISVARTRARSPASPPPFQQWLRRELVGMKLMAIRPARERIAVFEFESLDQTRRLIADLTREGKLVLLGELDRVLAISSELDLTRIGLHPGGIYSLPPSAPREEPALPLRLVPLESSPFPFAEAAEALFADKEQAQRAQEARRRFLQPLKKRLDRVSRTREKVLVEASRLPEAEQQRRLGELISQNLHRIRRGEKRVRLTEYTEHGPVEVDVDLQPERSAKQQVEWHFHQYRRFLRGSERASARLVQLDREADEVRRAIEQVQGLSDDEVLGRKEVFPSPKRGAPSRSRPYKEYFSSSGQRIWVGRDSRSNEELTFRLARPEDLWLHARGAAGSHVLVPLEKNVVPSSELLVDAGHLAVHHSSLKGERRGEVSYTKAKYVRKRKGDPAGTVNVAREKTFTVRVEPERLERLLASRARSSRDSS